MNTKGQAFGFAILVIFFILVLGLVATLNPLKEVFDDFRGNPALNCPGSSNFTQALFDADNSDKFAKLNKRTTCFVTGIGIVWFIGAFFLAAVAWLVRNWRSRPRSIGG